VLGWVDSTSPKFFEIAKNCVGLVSPSCSEGQSGAVVTCPHAGLIPITSYESGVDVESGFGVTLKNCSVEEIKNAIRRVSSLPPQQLKRMARKAWEFARVNHTRERFAAEYSKIVAEIMATEAKKEQACQKSIAVRAVPTKLCYPSPRIQ
jgi:glycosyltransferase involved in cell wall biosynthesis